MKLLKVQSVALVLLLLCSVCIAPVMAGTMATSGTRIIEDGVHLVKFEDSPTELDYNYYHVALPETVVVDGNQFYWVRIGSVKASTLSSNALAFLLCKGAFMVGTATAAGVIVYIASAGEVSTAGTGSPVILPAFFGAIAGIMAFYADSLTQLCPVVERWFVDNKFRVVASDGTILMCIDKNNVMGIQELQKSGIDISEITHLTTGGLQIKQQEL